MCVGQDAKLWQWTYIHKEPSKVRTNSPDVCLSLAVHLRLQSMAIVYSIRFDGDADEKLNQFAIQFIFYGTWAEFCSFVRLFLQPRKIQIRHKCSDGISALSRRRRCLVPKNADAVSLLHLLCIGIGVCK